MGFKIEDGLDQRDARASMDSSGSGRTDPLHYLDPKSRAQAWYDAGLQMVRDGLIDRGALLGHDQLRRRRTRKAKSAA